MVDDFCLNLIACSVLNTVGIALSESTYPQSADADVVFHLGDAPKGTYVASVDFFDDGAYLAIGLGTGTIGLWDASMGQRPRTMQAGGNTSGRSACLAWRAHGLTSGHSSGAIHHHDVRIPRHLVTTLEGHTGVVCGPPVEL